MLLVLAISLLALLFIFSVAFRGVSYSVSWKYLVISSVGKGHRETVPLLCHPEVDQLFQKKNMPNLFRKTL